MKSVINIKMAPLVLLLIAMVGCNKKLDIQPRQSIDAATALTTADDVEAAVVGAYSIMGGGALYGTNLFLMADLLAGDPASGSSSAARYVTWSGTFQGQRQIYNKTMTRDNSEASRTWIAGYRAINMANTVLDALNVVTDASKKAQLEGEALFIRGIMHFELVRYYALPWGATADNSQLGVVIRTKATKTETEAFEKTPRNTVAQVYQQVISDLTAAAAKLPANNGTRVTKYTAMAFLARVYLQQSDYAKARDAANDVIQSGKYRMNASVRAVFDNKNTAESIWEIQQNQQNNAGTSNDGMATFYASLPGIGRADVRIPTGFVNSYEPNDLRKQEWYYVGTGQRPGNTYNSKWTSFSQNLPVIRIAEMYLIRAETNLRLRTEEGDTPENDLAKVRNPIRTNLPFITNPMLKEDVLPERIFELAYEGVRIHDIKRLKGKVGALDWNDPKLVFPIPQRDIDASEGVLVQNPGY
ncbi:MAG: RagB/SusD family nutrient uptake outer membrane protein [Flavisolibacter sp.]|nr:RagB/SusD family nutrient uptake outer membrane protein [Flavisolibacter sp.]